MRTSHVVKALLVTAAAGLWLVYGDAGLRSALVLGIGAALVTWAWIVLGPPRRAPQPPPAPAHRPPSPEHRDEAHIGEASRARPVRDVGCPRSRRPTRH